MNHHRYQCKEEAAASAEEAAAGAAIAIAAKKKACAKVDTNSCALCEKTFKIGQEKQCVGCYICPRWYHRKCAKNPDVKKHWKCSLCR